jgi:hypothetical protein
MLSDLQEIGSYLYPLNGLISSNPLRHGWYPLALQDQIFLTATLWCSAEWLSDRISSPWKSTKETLESALLHQLRERLKSEYESSDATLSAVSCLAMTGVRYIIPKPSNSY